MYTAKETSAAIKTPRAAVQSPKNAATSATTLLSAARGRRAPGAMAPRPTAPSARRSPPFIGMPSSSVGNSPSTMDNNGHHHHPHRVDKDVEMFNADANAEAESETTPQMQQPRGRNGLRRVALEHLAQGGRQPEGQADRAAVCAAGVDCGERPLQVDACAARRYLEDAQPDVAGKTIPSLTVVYTPASATRNQCPTKTTHSYSRISPRSKRPVYSIVANKHAILQGQ
ncbi:uncharacterized protein B0H18DRAFT_263845 [Fomitopsis serialis]|uniref:uncharacterized protein n=1 Tax=Fomitopsis serialis TaxID=139415 RepID=UPI0020087E2D|nr:uncharacterized protein B0H18DRAFT_263845 [Neoantrodia serialis]KAH9928111.1 hypothetical protein B0H18DRAFT_263845 [Neoantrodia serialis]